MTPAPAPDDIQPVENETLDRFLTGTITAIPIIALFVRRMADLGRPAVLERPDRVRDHVRRDRRSASPSASTACSPTARSRRRRACASRSPSSARPRSRARSSPGSPTTASTTRSPTSPGDPHSPHVDHGHGLKGALRGLLHAHVGWLFIHTQRGRHERYAPDLLADPTDPLRRTSGSSRGRSADWCAAFVLGWLIGGSHSYGSDRTAVGWGRADARAPPRDLLDQLAVPLLRAPRRSRPRTSRATCCGWRSRSVRRGVAQQPPRVPDLGRARDARAGRSTPRRWSSARSRSSGWHGTSSASARSSRRKRARCMSDRARQPLREALEAALPERPFRVELWDGTRAALRPTAARRSRCARRRRSATSCARPASSASAART